MTGGRSAVLSGGKVIEAIEKNDSGEFHSKEDSPVWLLAWLIQKHEDFRVAEYESCADMASIPWPLYHEKEMLQMQKKKSAFLHVRVRAGCDGAGTEDANAIAKRAILTKGIYEVWGEGSTYEEVFESIRRLPQEKVAPYMRGTYRCRVRSPGRNMGDSEQMKIIRKFDWLPWQALVLKKMFTLDSNPNSLTDTESK